eukprot:866632-Pelagomonas_calceolata.AAC.1
MKVSTREYQYWQARQALICTNAAKGTKACPGNQPKQQTTHTQESNHVNDAGRRMLVRQVGVSEETKQLIAFKRLTLMKMVRVE